MQITVTTSLSAEAGGLFTLNVSPDLEVENLKVLCSLEPATAGLPPDQMDVIHDGQRLSDDKKTLTEYGVKSGDMLLVRPVQSGGGGGAQNSPGGGHQMDFSSIRVPNSNPAAGGGGGGGGGGGLPAQPTYRDPRVLLELLRSRPDQLALLRQANPELAEAASANNLDRFKEVLGRQQAARAAEERRRLRMLTADPFDEEAQRMIADEIRQQEIDRNMENAMEYHPESFGQVTMLYINCKVNGKAIKAFVDSGAQSTIMSKSCADHCGIMRLIDKRFSGIAKGVGVQRILGRVHLAQLQIENDFLATSFSILEDQPMEMLLGLDMLKRHQMVIDLKRNLLIIGTTATETPFLPEAELPASAKSFSGENPPPPTAGGSGGGGAVDRELQRALEQSMADSANRSSGPSSGGGSGGGGGTSLGPPTSDTTNIRNLLNAPPLSSSSGSSAALERLVTMGFQRDLADRMLQQFNGDENAAAAALLASSLQMPPPSR